MALSLPVYYPYEFIEKFCNQVVNIVSPCLGDDPNRAHVYGQHLDRIILHEKSAIRHFSLCRASSVHRPSKVHRERWQLNACSEFALNMEYDSALIAAEALADAIVDIVHTQFDPSAQITICHHQGNTLTFIIELSSKTTFTSNVIRRPRPQTLKGLGLPDYPPFVLSNLISCVPQTAFIQKTQLLKSNMINAYLHELVSLNAPPKVELSEEERQAKNRGDILHALSFIATKKNQLMFKLLTLHGANYDEQHCKDLINDYVDRNNELDTVEDVLNWLTSLNESAHALSTKQVSDMFTDMYPSTASLRHSAAYAKYPGFISARNMVQVEDLPDSPGIVVKRTFSIKFYPFLNLNAIMAMFDDMDRTLYRKINIEINREAGIGYVIQIAVLVLLHEEGVVEARLLADNHKEYTEKFQKVLDNLAAPHTEWVSMQQERAGKTHWQDLVQIHLKRRIKQQNEVLGKTVINIWPHLVV